MHSKNSDLIAAISIAMLNIGWTQIPNRPLLVGIIFALPLIFILPGYTITQVLTRQQVAAHIPNAHNFMIQPGMKKGRPLDRTDLLVLSLGLSLAIDVLLGFTLNIFPAGLQAQTWTLSLGLFTTLFALLAMFLRRGNAMQVAQVPKFRITLYNSILFGLTILIATSAIWFAIVRPQEPPSSFTQFWMLPANQAHRSCTVSIGVQNFELTLVTYHVVLLVNGAQKNSWSSITLAPRTEWVRSALLTPGSARSMFIEAQLYRVSKPNTVYRNVHLTFSIVAGRENGQVQQQCALTT